MQKVTSYTLYCSILLLFCITQYSYAQSEINFDGIVFPSYTTSARNPLTPTPGQCIYNQDESRIACYDGTQWLAAANGSPSTLNSMRVDQRSPSK